MTNAYEERQEARRARYLERAERARQESEARWNSPANQILHDMGGEPIKVGHHSERRHRRLIERAHRDCDRAVELAGKASHYERRAEAVGQGGISSDDPEVVDKLEAKLQGMEKRRERMKAFNAAFRKAAKRAKPEEGQDRRIATLILLEKEGTITYEEAERCARGFALAPWEKAPFPGYALSNLGANIRRVRDRLEELRQREEEPAREAVTGDGWRISEDPAENRILIEFEAIPTPDTRQALKAQGWRWNRRLLAWTRHLNANGRASARYVSKILSKD